MIHIGIDPGQSGGIAIIGKEAWAKSFKDMTEKDIWNQLQVVWGAAHMENEPIFAWLENVHSMPAQGVASSFKFGANWGFLKGLLTASAIPFELVSPQKWQGYLGCRTGGDKNVTKQFAQRLFPELKINHAIADALLICEYGKRTHK